MVEVSTQAPGAGLRAYETMIAAHAISHKSGVTIPRAAPPRVAGRTGQFWLRATRYKVAWPAMHLSRDVMVREVESVHPQLRLGRIVNRSNLFQKIRETLIDGTRWAKTHRRTLEFNYSASLISWRSLTGSRGAYLRRFAAISVSSCA